MEEYKKRLMLMNDDELLTECESMLNMSAYAANNPNSEFHTRCVVCYDVCKERDVEIYNTAYKNVTK